MRQLTATQKIAILENRVAQLEKQAVLDSFKAKVVETLKPFDRLVPETKKIIKDTRKSPKQIAKEYLKIKKNPNFKKAVKQVQKEAGSSPLKQVAYVIDAYKSGGLDSSRRASMRRRGLHPVNITEYLQLFGSVFAIFLIASFCISYLFTFLFGHSGKRGSMDKEAGVLSGVVTYLIMLGLMSGFGYLYGRLGGVQGDIDRQYGGGGGGGGDTDWFLYYTLGRMDGRNDD